MSSECLYCDNGQVLKDLMVEICVLKVSTVFLFKEQSYKGRCVVTYNEHGVDLQSLSEVELHDFMDDVTRVARAMGEIFSPAKINFGAYSDKLPHLHFHIVPKYVDGLDYGSTFTMNPQKVYLSQEEYSEMAEQIRKQLSDC